MEQAAGSCKEIDSVKISSHTLLLFENLESPVSCSMPSIANALSDELHDDSRSMTGGAIASGVTLCCCPP
jgi:hypothetical protein